MNIKLFVVIEDVVVGAITYYRPGGFNSESVFTFSTASNVSLIYANTKLCVTLMNPEAVTDLISWSRVKEQKNFFS